MKKKVEDLDYPDVVHCRSKEESDLINKYNKNGVYDWTEREPYLLLGKAGHSNSSYGRNYNNYDFSDIIFPESKEKAVHCTTQEEWDFVLDVIKNPLCCSNDWDVYSENSILYMNDGSRSNTDWVNQHSNKFKLLTFSQWLKESGNEEKWVEITKSEEPKPKFKVGDWVVQRQSQYYNFIDNITQIVKIKNDQIWVRQKSGVGGVLGLNRFCDVFREATQKEIDSVTKSKLSELDQWIEDNKDFEGSFEEFLKQFNDSDSYSLISYELWYKVPGDWSKEKAQYIWNKWGRSKGIEEQLKSGKKLTFAKPDVLDIRETLGLPEFDAKFPSKQDKYLEDNQESICKYCEDHIIEGCSITSTFQCEGSFCVQATESWLEDNPLPKPQETTIVDKSVYFPKTDENEIY